MPLYTVFDYFVTDLVQGGATKLGHWSLWVSLSQGTVAICLRCGEIFTTDITKVVECHGEIIAKIGRHLANLWTKL